MKTKPMSEIPISAGLGLFSCYATPQDVEAEKEHYDECTPVEVITLSAILKGLQEYSAETADDQMADGFSGQEATVRSHKYYGARQQLIADWS